MKPNDAEELGKRYIIGKNKQTNCIHDDTFDQ